MKVLYVGGIWPCEYSLLKESQNNPNFKVVFCNDGSGLSGTNLYSTIIGYRKDIDAIKSSFCPDIVVFRAGFITLQDLIADNELLWCQEIQPGNRFKYIDEKKVKNIAYQSKKAAEIKKGIWFPYCVSKHYASFNFKREKTIVVASSLVGDMYCLEHKIKSFDVLVKPLLDANISVDIFCGYNGGLDNLYYLKPFMYNIFPPLFALDKISSYKIYLSPTSIVSDEGCISYKTIEAMAFGCLVFTNWCYGIEDVCGENRDTIIYSNSPAETLEKVDYYLNNDEERIKIAKRGQEFVLSNYVWEDHFKRIILECGV